MDAREQRGLYIAAVCRVTRRLNGMDQWFVPSQSSSDTKYLVNLEDADKPTCNCPDFETRFANVNGSDGVGRCKHIYAAVYTLKRETDAEGFTTVTETLTVSETVEKRTSYPQNWAAYNRAQSTEKDRFQELLADLCSGIAEPERKPTRGQRPHSVKDSIFTSVFRVYCGLSSRRFSCDLKESHERGHLSRPIPGMKSVQFMENSDYTPILKELVHLSSLPLKAIETDFAVDSTGFGSSRFETWIDAKYGKLRREVVWVKCHIATGVKTNVVTAATVTDKDTHDSPYFIPLMNETRDGGFKIGEASADKAYGSLQNFEAIHAMGGEAFIAFKSNATGRKGGQLQKAFHYFQFNREEYLNHYHKRSNVESTFSAIKRMFGGELRSKTKAAMENEVYCKIVAHNLCCLLHAQQELGIQSVFWKNETPELKVLAV